MVLGMNDTRKMTALSAWAWRTIHLVLVLAGLIGAAAAVLLLPKTAQAANTVKYVNNGSADLNASASYTPSGTPGSTSDVTFANITYSNPLSFTYKNFSQTWDSLNDLSATPLKVTFGAQTMTLTSSGNVVPGAASSDLIYLAPNANLTLQLSSGSSYGTFTLGSNGNFNVGAGASLTFATTSASSKFTGDFNLTKTGAGTLNLTGSSTNSFGTNKTFTLAAGTLVLKNGYSLGAASNAFAINGGTTLSASTDTFFTGTAPARSISIGGNFAFTGYNGLYLSSGAVANNGNYTIQLYDGGSIKLSGVMTNTSGAAQTTTVNDMSGYASSYLVLGGYNLGGYAAVINGTGVLQITGAVTNGSSGLTYSGSGILDLQGANTYTGGTNLNGGIVVANQAESAGTSGPLGKSGTITFGGGVLQYGNNSYDYSSRFATTAQSMKIATNLQVVTFATSLMPGTAGSLTVQQSDDGGVHGGGGSLALTAANTYTGTTTVADGGTLTLDFANAATASNIIKSGNALVMSGGTLNLTDYTSATSQTFGTTTLSVPYSGMAAPLVWGTSSVSASAFTINNTVHNNTVAVNLGPITRNLGTTADFTLPTFGANSATNGYATTTGTANTILTSNGAAYATVNGGADWAAKDPTNGFIVGLSSLPGGGYTANTATVLAGNADMSAGNTTLAASPTLSSLRFNASNAVTITATGQTLTTGGILVTSNFADPTDNTITGGNLRGASGQDLVIIMNADTTYASGYGTGGYGLTIASTIVDNGSATGLTISGNGYATVTLSAANTFSGNTRIATIPYRGMYMSSPYGGLTLNNNLALQNSALEVTSMNGAVFLAPDVTTPTFGGLEDASPQDSLITYINSNNYVNITSLTLNPGTGVTHSYAGQIPDGATGMNLIKTGDGTQVLRGVNSYTGTTTISAGTLQFGTPNSLYQGDTLLSWTPDNIIVASSATLAVNVGGANEFTAGNVTTLLTNLGGLGGTVNNNGLQAGSKIGFDTTNATGGTFTIANNIADSTGTGGGPIGLTKLGTNTLILSGTNTFSGGVNINAGVLVMANRQALGTGVVTVTTDGVVPAKLQLQAGLTSSSSALTIAADHLTFAGGALSQMDITNNYLVITGGAATPSLVASYTGHFMTSSTLAGGYVMAAAVVTAQEFQNLRGTSAKFAGTTVISGDLLVRYTLAGDANLDGKITLDDYIALDAGYRIAGSPQDWAHGNFDGVNGIDPHDYALIDTNAALADPGLGASMEALHASWFGAEYLTALAALDATAVPDTSLALAALAPVPEPTSLALLGLGAAALLRRRRR